jgi:hypothetical protein
MTYDEMLNSSISEIQIRHLALQRQWTRELENTRLIMWEIRTKYLKKGTRIKPENIFKLSTDEKPIKRETSNNEWQKLINKWQNNTQ